MTESDPSGMVPIPERFAIDVEFPECVAREFPAEFDVAWQSGLDIIHVIAGRNMDALGRHSLGLVGCDWEIYLRCSVARAVRVAKSLKTRMPSPSRVLDIGSFLGNFRCRRLGSDMKSMH